MEPIQFPSLCISNLSPIYSSNDIEQIFWNLFQTPQSPVHHITIEQQNHQALVYFNSIDRNESNDWLLQLALYMEEL